jgi:hypothetical protein
LLSDRTALETTIWHYINENIKRTYENELVWIQDLQRAIASIPNENDVTENVNMKVIGQEEKSDGVMKYTVNSSNEISYVYFNDIETKLETERNILDIITALAESGEHDILRLFGSIEEAEKWFLNLKQKGEL